MFWFKPFYEQVIASGKGCSAMGMKTAKMDPMRTVILYVNLVVC